jgi:hypothetical protein
VRRYLSGLSLGVTGPQEKYAHVISAAVRLRVSALDTQAMSDLISIRDAAGYWAAGGSSAATDVEMSGYAIGALVAAGELGECTSGVRWIATQRNDVGGFHSTQDTVVALRGLATFSKEVSATVGSTVTLKQGEREQAFTLNAENFDVLQTWSVETSGELQATAAGAGLALVSIAVAANVFAPPEPPKYNIDVWYEVKGDDVVGGAWDVHACFLPTEGRRLEATEGQERGMLLLEVGMFTGFRPAPEAESELKAACGGSVVMRVEPSDEAVVVYMDPTDVYECSCVQFSALKTFDVQKLQDVNSRVSEYYAPENQGSFRTSIAYSSAPPEIEPPESAAALIAFAAIAALA